LPGKTWVLQDIVKDGPMEEKTGKQEKSISDG
jgi:hypothetical protein